MSRRGPGDDTPLDAATLARIFVASAYRVQLAGGIDVRVGQRCPALERAVPARHYGYITAHNPAARARADAANTAADASLAERLDQLGLSRVPMRSQAADGSACECGWLVLDAGDATLDALGHAYGQAAVLGWRARQCVVLRMLMPAPAPADPGGSAHGASVHWAGSLE